MLKLIRILTGRRRLPEQASLYHRCLALHIGTASTLS
jgi:hypothetical protein